MCVEGGWGGVTVVNLISFESIHEIQKPSVRVKALHCVFLKEPTE